MKIPRRKITKIRDIRAGDRVMMTLRDGAGPTPGPRAQVYTRVIRSPYGSVDALYADETLLAVPERNYWIGAILETFSAERPEALPQEVGSIIKVHAYQGQDLPKPRMAMRLHDGLWAVTHQIGEDRLLRHEDITLWSPVPEEDA